ncbi:MAG: hypothetical protein IPN76_05935 [Saprospiraceae bacterium]|nr:hypothetical protein [Saprospiraceae bacterium]
MPLHNLIVKHITAEHKTDVNKNIDDIDTVLENYVVNLSSEERQKYGSIDEDNKLFANKVMDYRNSEPNRSSPQVDWVEFEADYVDRVTIEGWINRLMSMVGKLQNTKILHDFDNYQNGLVDYKYTQYMDDTEEDGYSVKRQELAQFFKRPSSGGDATGGTPPPTPPPAG